MVGLRFGRDACQRRDFYYRFRWLGRRSDDRVIMGFFRRSRIGTSHNSGLAQVGLWFPEPTFDWWAINACKQQVNAWVASAASNTNWPSLIDDNGYPTAIPAGAGAKWISSQLYIYGTSPDIWVLDWVGTATLGITTTAFTGGGLSESVINSNRREYTITGTPLSTIDNATAGGP